jgi:NAD(P)-dependent dehydrogenase (short-subunit alcohol dehydrogenase family)
MIKKKLFDLTGKTAVVTGGSGILGKEFCEGLACYGANLAIVDINSDQASKDAETLKKQYGVNTVGLYCDVTDPESIKSMTESVENTLGKIDILHNNAATKGNDLKSFFAPLESYSLETWREIMAVNLDGMFLVAQHIGSKMAERGHGSIIQTASIYGAIMGPDQRIYEGSEYMGMTINTPPVYPVSKGGVVALSNYLSTYWAKNGVRVNTLSPGGVGSGQNDVFSEKYSNRVPMNRMATPNEMVGALIFLASSASSYITGQNIIVDGGLSAW